MNNISRTDVASQIRVSIQITFLFILVITAFLGAWLAKFYGYYFIPPLYEGQLLVEWVRAGLNPEPTERFVYLTLSILIPILTLASILLNRKYFKSFNFKYNRESITSSIIIIFLFASFIWSDFLPIVLGENDKSNKSILVLFCVGAALLLCHRLSNKTKFSSHFTENKSNYIVVISLVSYHLLQLFSWRLLSINSVDEAGDWSGAWTFHADALIYSLSQVINGKTVLFDFPSQYGYWCELAGPLFMLIGFSIIHLTLFFAILQSLSLGLIFYVLFNNVKTPLMRLCGGMSLITLTFGTSLYFSGINDPYFQYWPLRFFWPALSVYMFYVFSLNKTRFNSSLMTFIGAIGALWNMDSGVFIVIGFGAYLFFGFIISSLRTYKSEPRHLLWTTRDYLTALGLHIIILVIVTVIFSTYLWLKSTGSINVFWLFSYQSIFYKMGLAMIALPHNLHPWMSILALYLLGFVSSLYFWIYTPNPSPKNDLILYLSFLGFGLYFYYQGRSHVFNLISVCWPAIIIATIFCDQYLRSIRVSVISKRLFYMPVPMVTIGLVCCVSFFSHAELMATSIFQKILLFNVPNAPYVQDEISFIKSHSTLDRDCFILSKRQGIYYAESRKSSPMKGPGLVEMLLESDRVILVNQLLDGAFDCVFYGVGEHTRFDIQIDESMLYLKYEIKDVNKESTMLYLVKNN